MCDDERSVFRRAELLMDGHSRRSIAHAVRFGLLDRPRHGLYARPDACAAVIDACLHGGSLACVSAAAHAGLWTLDARHLHVWMRHGGHRRGHDGCDCIEHWDEGAPSTYLDSPSLARVLWQIYGCVGAESFFVALESALHLGLIGTTEMRWLRRWLPSAAIRLVDLARSTSESGLESLVHLRLSRHGLQLRAQVRIFGVGRVDFLIGDRLILEVDGREGHADAASRHKDLRRDANAASWGYVTLRFDYATVLDDWDLVERAILAQVALARHLR